MKFQKNKEEKENEIMKRIKKIASLLLAMVMVFAMSVTAFATETNTPVDKGNFTITIEDTEKNYVYEAYQIFKGDLQQVDNKKTLSNIQWGDGVDTTKLATALADTDFAEDNVNKKYPNDPNEKLSYAAKIARMIADGGEDVAEAFAAAISKALSATATGTSTPTLENDQTVVNYKITGLKAGYYFVKNTSVAENGAYTSYILEVVGDVAPTPKRDLPKPDKKILEDGKELEKNEASIGDTVTYQLKGTMPGNIADYKTYSFAFIDTLSKGLTAQVLEDAYENGASKLNAKVYVRNGDEGEKKEVTNYFYKGVTKNDDGTTTIEVTIGDVKALANISGAGIVIDKTTQILVEYDAVLNEDAVIANVGGNPNTVKLQYSNDPNNSGEGNENPPEENPKKPVHPDGVTPEITVITYTTELTILKTDDNQNFLPGVEFTLTGESVKIVLVTEETFTEAADGEYWKLKDSTYTTTAPTVADDETDNTADYESTETKYTKTTTVVAKGEGKDETSVVGTVQADGTVTFKGLGAGEYTITETKTLPGYNTIDPIVFNITFDAAKTPMFESDNNKVMVGKDNVLDTSIINKKGSLLPSTGGIGTTIFYVVGGILVIGAGILLVTKRRMKAQ